MKGVILLLLVALVASEHRTHKGDREHFDGDQAIQVVPQTTEQADMLREREKSHDLDFWGEEVGPPHHPVEVHVKKAHVAHFKEWLIKNGFEFRVLIENLESAVMKEEAVYNSNGVAFAHGERPFNYDRANTLSDIHNELKHLASKYKRATLFSVGKSFEGREMLAIKVSKGRGPKPVIFVDGCIHAREWLTTASVMVFLKQLLQPRNYFRRRVNKLLSKYDVYVLPVFNVDGYEYTKTARFWRKTRSKNPGSTCVGVDPNRNWNDHFGGKGTSSDPCSDIYRGTKPFSEIEVKQVADLLTNLKKTVGLKSYWNVHAFSQLLLYPYSYTKSAAADDAEMKRVGDIFKNSVQRTNGKLFTVGQPSHILYEVSGSSMDWAYNTLGVKYAYAPELRPGDFRLGASGFLIRDEKMVKNSGKEMTNGILDACLAMQ